jgi:hypothetical protein
MLQNKELRPADPQTLLDLAVCQAKIARHPPKSIEDADDRVLGFCRAGHEFSCEIRHGQSSGSFTVYGHP